MEGLLQICLQILVIHGVSKDRPNLNQQTHFDFFYSNTQPNQARIRRWIALNSMFNKGFNATKAGRTLLEYMWDTWQMSNRRLNSQQSNWEYVGILGHILALQAKMHMRASAKPREL